MIRYILLILLLVFCFDVAICQTSNKKISISGTVLDGTRRPISNAIIIIDNTKTGSVTDLNGKYKVRVKADAVRIGVVTFGNGVMEEDISGRTIINFNFKPISPQNITNQYSKGDEEAIKEANTYVNVGYNYVKKKDIINNISVFDPSTRKKAYSSVYDMIIELPGIQIINGTINIGGARNLWGFVGPMILVDGIERPLSDVRPFEVETITVLKDASAAIYGSRGFGGVILIKRKKIDPGM